MYRRLIRPLLFRFDPERVHHWVERLICHPLTQPLSALWALAHARDAQVLNTKLCGIELTNPVGVAAGFDKNATMYPYLHRFGFSFVEVGTVTAQAQGGNPRPRLFRLPRDQALVNRMGFNNDGVEEMAERVKSPRARVPVGGNIGKTKIVPLDDAVADYTQSFLALRPYVDFFVINVSSPNTPGLRELQGKNRLAELLRHLIGLNKSPRRPILLKIAPDLSMQQLADIVDVVGDTGIHGVIATNTTVSRAGLSTPQSDVARIGDGGLSGKPLRRRSDQVIAFLRKNLPSQVDIVGVGGVFSGLDAYRKIQAGAACVQLYTGFIYGGPRAVYRIKRDLLFYVKRDGLTCITEAVGVNTDQILKGEPGLLK